MRRGRPPYAELLTPREQEVLSLIQDGLTNAQIAERLGISESGARYHVSEILSKLGVESRQEAAAWRELPGRPALAGLPVIDQALRKTSRFASQLMRATIALAGIALLALAIAGGIALYRAGDPAPGTPPEDPHSYPETGDFIRLTEEATRVGLSTMPDGVLFQVNYEASSGLYYFRFTEAAPMHEMHVVGPGTDPRLPRWQVSTTGYANLEGFDLSPLDVAEVQHSFADVATAAAQQAGSPGAQPDLVLWSSFDTVQWAATFFGAMHCYAADGGHLQNIHCGLPAPTSPSSP